jgi:hypothetical protein
MTRGGCGTPPTLALMGPNSCTTAPSRWVLRGEGRGGRLALTLFPEVKSAAGRQAPITISASASTHSSTPDLQATVETLQRAVRVRRGFETGRRNLSLALMVRKIRIRAQSHHECRFSVIPLLVSRCHSQTVSSGIPALATIRLQGSAGTSRKQEVRYHHHRPRSHAPTLDETRGRGSYLQLPSPSWRVASR